MEAIDLGETFDSLLSCDDDVTEEDIYSTSPSLSRVPPFKHERFLVAWVLLSRAPQEQLDRAWKKFGTDLSHFASCFLTSCDNDDIGIFVDDYDPPQHRFDNFLFYIYCTRLVAKVTARLTNPPSKELRINIVDSWKQISTIIAAGNLDDKSSATQAAKLHSTIFALCVDIYNAVLTWMSNGNSFFPSNLQLKDVWNVPIAAYTKIKPLAPIVEQLREDSQEGKNSGIPEVQDKEGAVMLNVLENLLHESHTQDVITDEDGDNLYTMGNLLRLIFVIFELQGSEFVSDELVRIVLLSLTSTRSQDIVLDPDLRILWDRWLLKNIAGRMKKKKKENLLLDPEVMDAIQNIVLAHAVSPTESDLRPMAWQSMSQITKSCGWGWIQKSSKTSLCTWCRLACGEWKIQLEDKSSKSSNKLSTLDGCGNLIINVVKYLVDFDEYPYKTLPLTSNSLLSIKQALQETLSVTSDYLVTSSFDNDDDDDIKSEIIVTLWSTLFSEIHVPICQKNSTVISCFTKLLKVSDDESLVPALLHVLNTGSGGEVVNKADLFNNIVIECIVIYMKRFWSNIATSDYPSKNCTAPEIIYSACVATEILTEYQPQKIEEVVAAIFAALQIIVASFGTGTENRTSTRQKELLQPISSTCKVLLQHSANICPKEMQNALSSAVNILVQ